MSYGVERDDCAHFSQIGAICSQIGGMSADCLLFGVTHSQVGAHCQYVLRFFSDWGDMFADCLATLLFGATWVQIGATFLLMFRRFQRHVCRFFLDWGDMSTVGGRFL